MANSTAKEVSHIPKFNGNNFSSWRFGLNMLLEQHKLQGIVYGTDLIPAEATENDIVTNQAVIDTWKERDCLARNFLYFTLTGDMQEKLETCMTAADMWNRLTIQQLHSASQNQQYVQTLFFNYQYITGNDIMSHIQGVEKLATQLKNLNIPATVEQIITKIIGTLPSSFRHFPSVWENVPKEERTIQLLTSRLLIEEETNKRYGLNENKSDNMAFQSQAKQSNENHRHSNGGWKRNSRGNFQGERQEEYNYQRGNEIQNKRLKRYCEYCHGNNHVIETCRVRIRHEKEREYGRKKYNYQNEKREKQSTSFKASADEEHQNQKEEKKVSFSFPASTHNLKESHRKWFADSGATQHVTDQILFFISFTAIQVGTWMVSGIGDSCLAVHGIGDVEVETRVDGELHSVIFKNVLYVPELGTSLFSIGAATEQGAKVVFMNDAVAFSVNNKTIMKGKRTEKTLYVLDIMVKPRTSSICSLAKPMQSSLERWHQRLAHVNYKTIRRMLSGNAVDGLNVADINSIPTEPCKGCIFGKMKRTPFKTGRIRGTKIGNLVHSDVCGPIQILSTGGARFFAFFKDDFSGFNIVYFLKNKSEIYGLFQAYVARVERETGNKIQTMRSDNGGEYVCNNLQDWLLKKGIRHEKTVPYTPQQNGVVERANRTVMEAARSLIHSRKLPLNLWAEAINWTIYVLNRVLSSTTDTTPYEKWYGSKPDISDFLIFGSKVYIHIPDAKRQKLDAKGLESIYLGKSETSKGIRAWDPVNCKLHISRDYISDEDSNCHLDTDIYTEDTLEIIFSPNNQEAVTQVYEGAEIEDNHPDYQSEGDMNINEQENEVENNQPDERIDPEEQDVRNHQVDGERGANMQEIEVEADQLDFQPDVEVMLRRSSRIPKHTEKFKNWRTSLGLLSYNTKLESFEPNTYKEAIQCEESDQWVAAINDEYSSLIKNETWILTSLPPGRNAIKSKWVFKVKPGHGDTLPRYKARLVAKGYTQREGIDYQHTFAPVVKHDSLRMILSIAAAKNLEMTQLDIKTAFLYGTLDVELYLEQPEGFVKAGQEKEVCLLKKCLYGLKQASRVWNAKFDEFLVKFGLKRSKLDPCVYHRNIGQEYTVMCIYVDDGLICSNEKAILLGILNYLSQQFEIRSLPAERFVGLNIERDRLNFRIFISQTDSIIKILRRFNMEDCHPRSVPADPNSKLSAKMSPKNTYQQEEMESVPYREAVGCLMYIMVMTRPDISFAVGQVARFSSKPGPAHWEGVKRIFSYLAGTVSYGLCFSGRGKQELIGFADSDFAGDVDTRRSTSGFIFLRNDGPISWKSKLQRNVTLSTAEAEYVAASEASREAVWLKRSLDEIECGEEKAVKLSCDNQSAIRLASNPECHQRTKHIETKYHFIRERQGAGEIEITYVNTDNQLADILTKPLPGPRFHRLRKLLGIGPFDLKVAEPDELPNLTHVEDTI